MRKSKMLLMPFLVLLLIAGAVGCGAVEETPAPTPSPSPSPTPTPSPTLNPATHPTPTPTPAEQAALPQLQVHFIDVGQGDSILLDLGETEVLIDAGGRSPGVVSYLQGYVDDSLEALIATHPHADHIGGLIAVLDAFTVEQIWYNGAEYDSKTYGDFMGKVDNEGAEVNVARRGDVITVGDLTFNVLHPVEPLDSNTNNNSIVLSLSYGDIDFLFTGDAEKEAESSMLVQSVVQVPDIDILKVGHHGSRTASSQGFLNIIKPEVAIYMARTDNSYGHPHEETMEALAGMGVEVYGTDVHGTVVVVTEGVEYTVYGNQN